MIIAVRRRLLATVSIVAAVSLSIYGDADSQRADAASDIVAAAKAAVLEYAGPQTT